MRVAYALLLVELLLASSVPAAPPAGQTVLNAAARSMGRFAPGATMELRGSIAAEGRTGDYREIVRMRDGAFVDRARYSLFGDADGYDGLVRWKQDRSGTSHHLNAPFSKADAVTLAWLKRRGFLTPGSAKIERVLRETINGRRATVLTMRPRGGNPIKLVFDDRTHLLVRVQRTRPLSITTETYGDYRRLGGAMVPFKIESEDSGDHQIIRVNRYDRVENSGRTNFVAPPEPRDTIIAGPARLALDSLGFQVVSARINGHQYDFILDTGGHNIVTPEVAAQLGLTAEGQGTSGGSGAGRVTQSDTRVAKLEIGSAVVSDQHFYIIGLGNAVKRQGKPPMAGILGLEVFERMAITVDEPGKRLVIEPFQPGRPCEGDKISLLFDDDMPSVRGKIDGIPALLGIDTGNAGPVAVLWRWAVANGVAAKFRSGKAGTSSGLGGNSNEWSTPHHELVVGRTAIHDLDMRYVEDKAGYFSSRTDSANVGHTLLRRYAVRFDYSQGHMCVMKPRA